MFCFPLTFNASVLADQCMYIQWAHYKEPRKQTFSTLFCMKVQQKNLQKLYAISTGHFQHIEAVLRAIGGLTQC